MRPLQSLRFTPAGRVLLSSASDGGVRVWSVERGQEVGRVELVSARHRDPTDWCELSMSDDGERIAIGYRPVGNDRTDVRVVDVCGIESQ